MSKRRLTHKCGWAFLCLSVMCLAAGNAIAAGKITIQKFEIAAADLKPGEAFEIAVEATGKGVDVISYTIRTTQPLPQIDTPPAFTFYNKMRSLAYLVEGDDVYLLDNGKLDLDPREGAYRIRVSTDGWPEGRHDLILFAQNRPGDAPQVMDKREFAVLVEPDQVQVFDATKVAETRFQACDFEPDTVNPGEPVTLVMKATMANLIGVEVRRQWRVLPEDSLPDFTYDAGERTSILEEAGERLIRNNGSMDRSPEKKVMRLRFDTAGLSSGLYFFTVRMRSSDVGRSDERHVAFKIQSPGDVLEVSLSEPWWLTEGTHANIMSRTDQGMLLYGALYSTDEGRTWQTRPNGSLPSCQQLRDGTIIGMSNGSEPIKGREGWYRGSGGISKDGGLTVKSFKPEFYVPQSKPAMGHAYHKGPLYMRTINELENGDLVAYMAGWFKGDDTICPHSDVRPYSRAYACISQDGGMTWKFLSNIGYDEIGSEGYNEGSVQQMPNGDLIAAMRTGNMRDQKCQDNPIMISRSSDGGKTWTEPWRSGLHGAYPDLVVLSDGRMALSYGRPGAAIAFSADEGRTWADQTIVDTTPYSGYTTIVELDPGVILMAYGTKDRVDPETSEVGDGIYLKQIEYSRK